MKRNFRKGMLLLEALAARAIKFSTDPGDTVLDPFFGVGNTGLACLKAGVKFIGIEKSERYCDTVASRLRDRRLQLDFEQRQLRLFEVYEDV